MSSVQEARWNRELVEGAITKWTKDLIDTGKRNPLLYYRDLKAGTLDLSRGVERMAFSRLLAGKATSMSALFRDEDLRADARKRLRTIRRRTRELREERGISTGYLAMGMATWAVPETQGPSRPPAAPVVLREVDINPSTAAEDDFELQLAETSEINPVLLHFLAEEHGIVVDADELLDLLSAGMSDDVTSAFERLEKHCGKLREFRIDSKSVIGNFSYQKLPMVNDLKKGVEFFVASDVIAALAGDTSAQAALRAGTGATVELSAPDHTPPENEFLVLDADSSQSYAINAALSGEHLVVKGPPGTGKSQTITNLIASLMAHGQRVLFVAEKRAAIDAVLGRLDHVGLSSWVMDLHDGVSNRRKVAQQLAETLDRASRTPQVDTVTMERALVSNRDRLVTHRAVMHTPRDPWGMSVFELQSRRLGLDLRSVEFRLRGDVLRRAVGAVVDEAKEAITEYADLGGLEANENSPWEGAPVRTAEQARDALDLVVRLRETTVPQVSRTLSEMIAETGLLLPSTVAMWRQAFDLLDRAADLGRKLELSVCQEDLAPLIAATATRRWRKQNQVTMGWGERRRRVKRARAFTVGQGKASKSDLHAWLQDAARLTEDWNRASTTGEPPRVPGGLDGAHGAYERLTADLRALAAFLHSSNHLEELDPQDSLPKRLDTMVADRGTLHRLPRRHRLEQQLIVAGFGGLIEECRLKGIGADEAAEVLEAAWLQSILDEIAVVDQTYGSLQGTTLDRAAEAFREADHAHIRTAAARVRRRCAESLYEKLDRHPDQATVIHKQARLKRRHASMRDLLTQAPDVLLALKPCWAMSPLVVSQVLPLARLFDVVIFDEASQIPPADAIPTIARGSRIVVAGDERQLPPTSFFSSAAVDDEEVEEEIISLTSGFESILDALAPIVRTRSLEWHYRSQDERLIAFSNAHIYDSSLTTFPGAHVDGVLRHVHVPWQPGDHAEGSSSQAEVQQVVDLVLEHAETRPDETLGVITMGINHAMRIEAALRERLRDRRDLDEFFSESREERFFVKNLERVQGDERDAIILSIGYGKGPTGRMQYRFGPLNQEGGERRLNVAVSRAKRRMTLVSSFTSADLDPSRLGKRGAELLGAFVTFMESGGTDLGSVVTVPPKLNAFERDVRDRLTAAGLQLTAQYGVSGYRIDFVASHPSRPGQYVLAIEADGASYHSSATARDRDRLRQEHLERLGWRFHRIWSTDWFRDPDTEVAKVREAFDAAVAAVDAGDQAGGRVARTAPVTTQAPTSGPKRSGPRPRFPARRSISEYSHAELVGLVTWIESDGLLRTEEQVLAEAMAELGFSRRGSQIVSAISAAIAESRAMR